jgi:hypothetical protein
MVIEKRPKKNTRGSRIRFSNPKPCVTFDVRSERERNKAAEGRNVSMDARKKIKTYKNYNSST